MGLPSNTKKAERKVKKRKKSDAKTNELRHEPKSEKAIKPASPSSNIACLAGKSEEDRGT
jgi:hypothetical protein